MNHSHSGRLLHVTMHVYIQCLLKFSPIPFLSCSISSPVSSFLFSFSIFLAHTYIYPASYNIDYFERISWNAETQQFLIPHFSIFKVLISAIYHLTDPSNLPLSLSSQCRLFVALALIRLIKTFPLLIVDRTTRDKLFRTV